MRMQQLPVFGRREVVELALLRQLVRERGRVHDTTDDAVNRLLGAKTTTISGSCASDAATSDLDRATASLHRTTKELKNRLTDLKTATKAVTDSKLDKTVDDANALYKETDGRVADDKTREILLKAVKARDTDAIAKAVKEVNESKAAKEKADAEAKAKAEQEAAEAKRLQERHDDRSREERYQRTQTRVTLLAPVLGSCVSFILGLLVEYKAGLLAALLTLFH